MATIHTHRVYNPGRVTLEHEFPTDLLTGASLKPVRDLHDVYLAAQADVTKAHDALAEASDAKGIRDSEIVAAVRNGTPVPAAMSDLEAETIIKVATAALDDTLRRCYLAALAFETGLTEHREAIRNVLQPAYRTAAAKAEKAADLAAKAEAHRSMILAAFQTLDFATAAQDAKASDDARTRRFESALFATAARLGDGASVETDFFQEEEYRFARMGAAAVVEVQGLVARLTDIVNGNRTFTTAAARLAAEAPIRARLSVLGHSINI